MPLPRLITDGVWGYFPYRWATTTPPDTEVDDIPVPPSSDDLLVADTPEAYIALLTADAVEVDFGVNLFNAAESEMTDITDDILGGVVSHQCYDTIHGTVQLQLTRELDWDSDKVQPWMKVSSDTYTATFYLGMYSLTTPDINLGNEPIVYDVTGYDKLRLPR